MTRVGEGRDLERENKKRERGERGRGWAVRACGREGDRWY